MENKSLLNSEEMDLVKEGKWTSATILLKRRTDLGLKQAKDLVCFYRDMLPKVEEGQFYVVMPGSDIRMSLLMGDNTVSINGITFIITLKREGLPGNEEPIGFIRPLSQMTREEEIYAHHGQRIECIKCIRQRSGRSLHDAKNLMDDYLISIGRAERLPDRGLAIPVKEVIYKP